MLGGCGADSPGKVPVFSHADAAVESCPTHLDLTLLADSSRSESGWTGLAYGIGPLNGSYSTVEIIECDEDCRRCSFHGPVRGDQPAVHQRCLNDVSTICSQDEDCGEGGMCRFMWPPFNGFNFCDLVYFEPTGEPDPSPMRGVFDFATGQIDFDALNLRVGISLAGVCGDCDHDDAADGQARGTCRNTGAACDVAGTQDTPPLTSSYDCAPLSFTDLGFGVPASGASTTPTFWTMDDTRPKCTVPEYSELSCWCGVCEDGTPCFSDDQCSPGSTCGYPGEDPANPQYKVQPDACVGSCDWDEATQSGTCTNAGGGTVGCLPRSGTIEVRAGAKVEVPNGYYLSTIGLLTCVPATDNEAINLNSGLPGPLYYRADFEVRPRVR